VLGAGEALRSRSGSACAARLSSRAVTRSNHALCFAAAHRREHRQAPSERGRYRPELAAGAVQSRKRGGAAFI
jgi:predicted alpha/beta-hydrolase family hydrolase